MLNPELIVRRPRHEVVADDQVAAWIASGQEDPNPWHAAATLLDLSRNGCRLFCVRAMNPGDHVRLVIDQPDAERQSESPAIVRWRRAGQDGLWEHGLEFSPELEWEFLGELFLSGTLADR